MAFEIDSNILAAASAIITLIAAYFIGNIVKQAVINISEKSGIRQKVRFGIQKEAQKLGFNIDIIYIAALILKYITYIIGIYFALKVLPFQIETNSFIMPIISYLPNIVSAMCILIFGSAGIELFADVVKYKLRDTFDEDAEEAGVFNFSTSVATYVRYFSYTLILLTVILQLGIKADNLIFLVLSSGIIVLLTIAVLLIISTREYVSNISAGKYLKTNKVLAKGDFLEINEVRGKIEEINLMMTVISENGKRYYIPNSKIATNIFSVKKITDDQAAT